MANRTQRSIEDEIDAIEARALTRAERDTLQAPLLAELRDVREAVAMRGRIQRDLATEIVRAEGGR